LKGVSATKAVNEAVLGKALPRAGTRLLLIGDAAQLPPIGAGLVFHRLVQESYGPQIELKQVWRQSEDTTGIPAVARAVRQGVVPKLAEQLLPEGVCFIGSEEPLRDCLRLRTEMLSAGAEVIVLTVGRQGQFEAAVHGEPRALLRRVGFNLSLNLHAATSSHL
jgi:hypothetical protein